MQYKKICGRTFEVINCRKAEKFNALCLRAQENRGKGLYTYYKNPSDYKQDIYEDWYNWYLDNEPVEWFGVCSGSCFTFSIMAIYVNHFDEIVGVFHITKDHNRFYTL